MNVFEAPVTDIKTNLVVRRVCGLELNGLMRSIDTHGLLHPVGLTKDYELVYGYRRFQAFQRMGRDCIPAVFVNKEQYAYSAMHDENEMCKVMTPEEKVLLAQKLEEETRKHRPALWRELGLIKDEQEGNESSESGSDSQIWENFPNPAGEVKNELVGQDCPDLDKPDRKDKENTELNEEDKKQGWGNFPKHVHEDKESKRSDSMAAKAVGLGDRKTYRKAKTVVSQGSQPLKDAMNQNKVSIDAAYQLSKLPEDEQAAIDYDNRQAVKEKVRHIRKPPEKPCTNPDIDRVLELTDGWPEDQVLTLIEVLKMKIKGHSHDCH